MSGITTLIIVGAVMFSVLGGITLLAYVYSLNNIKSKTVGDGQHGTARWMTKGEQRRVYRAASTISNIFRLCVLDHSIDHSIYSFSVVL